MSASPNGRIDYVNDYVNDYVIDGMLDDVNGYRGRDPGVVVEGEAFFERIDAHILEHIGDVATVFHERSSEAVHLDVYWVAPTPTRDFHTLITVGMSRRPMNVPEGSEAWRYAELLLSLPSQWPVSMEAFRDERHFWPFRGLKGLARYPHRLDTWLAPGHSVPGSSPRKPFAANTKLCAWLLWWPSLVDADFPRLRLDRETTVNFLAAIPLYEEELAFKLEHGADALVERLAARQVTELIDIHRPNTCV